MARDREIDNPFTKDLQVTAIRGARSYRGDKLIRVATPHRLLDPKAGPLIAVRLQHPDPQDARRPGDRPVRPRAARRRRAAARACTPPARWPGSAAAACTATASLEGTFLGGCIFSGRVAGRAAAAATA